MEAHLFGLKKTAFILWRPRHTQVTPKLVLGQFQPGNPPTLGNRREFELEQMPEHTDLWGISAGACSLTDGQVYHYWFEVTDSSPFRDGRRILCTDPTAFTIDWRLLADRLPAPYDVNDQDPAAVVKFENGQLVPCDAAGETFAPASTISADKAQPNNRIVIYELPTTWTKINVEGNPQIGVGTFRDVLALVRTEAEPMNFDGIRALERGRSHLQRLGVNALELLPLADSFVDREWGYATSNYFAPDFDLGFPSGNSSPTSNTDLIELITACHDLGIRFIIDVVMAFGTRAALENVNFDDFHIDPKLTPQDPDTQQSTGQGTRDGFGGRLWRYARIVSSYDPVAGTSGNFSPARQLMKAYLLRWLSDFAVDGVRMDSVNNIANWDFVQEFKESRPPTLAGQRRDGRQIPRRGRRAFCAKHPPKQRDAVNYERLEEPFRRRVFDYIARLVKFRIASDALSVNDTDFIHVDFNDGKRVVVWRRARSGSDQQVVVVANFSEFITANALSGNAEYFVPNWPATPSGKRWREITQERDVPNEKVAHEPIFPWEAKVYTLVDP